MQVGRSPDRFVINGLKQHYPFVLSAERTDTNPAALDLLKFHILDGTTVQGHNF